MNRIKNLNRTFHLLQKADILTCYEHEYASPESAQVIRRAGLNS